MLGAGVVTVKAIPLLAAPPTVTTTFPEVAPLGTGTVMLVALQLVGVPVVPLNFTVLVPCVAPKLVPVIVTEVPAAADVGLKLKMLTPEDGAGAGPPPVADAQPSREITMANKTLSDSRSGYTVVRKRNFILEILPLGEQACSKHQSVKI